ncbi:hypothetical protein PV04_04112 [Phialophora macrospora]|uniref:Fungal N-terminal domain-containing protein n=1 Tax=Phialophora macrospora TaxID=1851006 RepID=A0A0D2CSJ2_9EURO|nr:hypothetical protein PV04_04112 [Phialophora macrospora]
MTDPFSVASGAIGVISLGLTVCDGLISYLSAFKGQTQFLSSLSRRAEDLNKCLRLLHQLLPPLRTRTPDVARKIEESLAECESAILDLQGKVAAFQRVQGPSLKRDSLHHVSRRVIFPFKKDALLDLSGTIDNLQQNLETVLAIANLEATSTQLNVQNVVNNKVDAVITISAGIGANIQNASQDISSLRTDFSTIEGDLRMLRSTLDPGLQAIMRRIDHLAGQVATMRVSPTTSKAISQSVNLQACTIQQQLIAKPSLFHKFCVEAQGPKITAQKNLPSQEIFSSACSCRYLNRRHKPGKQILSFEYTRDTDHEEHCPFYIEGIKQRRLQFKFSYCSTLISRSLRVVAGLTSGAGGNSLCAQIDWIPIVSSRSSPAMQLLSQLLEDILIQPRKQATLLEIARLALLKLFVEGQSHPREVDEYGCSLVEHAMNFSMWFRAPEGVEAFSRLLYSLASLGAKAPASSFINNASYSATREQQGLGLLAKRLIGIGALEPDLSPLHRTWWIGLTFFPEWHDVLENGPLSLAIMRRDPLELCRLLQSNRHLLLEVDDWGHTPLHLSAIWPLGIILLFKYGGASLVNQKDECGRLPLTYAMQYVHPIQCEKGGHGYLNATKLLLAAGSAIADSQKVRDDFAKLLEGLLAVGDTTTADLMVEAFAHRRQHLQKLAETHLAHHFWHRNDHKADRILDEQALEVVLALSKAGVNTPPACAIPPKQTTIWHCPTMFMKMNAAQKLFDAGFRDIEGHDHRGHTPLTIIPLHSNRRLAGKLELAEWFCNHGANLLCSFPPCRGDCTNPAEHQRPGRLKAIHSLVCPAPVWGEEFALESPVWSSEFLATILNSSITDGCACACSEQGCVPGVNLLSRIPQLRRDGKQSNPWNSLASRLSSAFDNLFMPLIRLWTFEALKLTHTCCRHGCANHETQWNKTCPFSTPMDDETQEIQDEERELISFHEALMFDFADTWLACTKGPRYFLSKVWRPRLQQIRRERAKLSEEEIAGFIRLGVVFDADDTDISQGVQSDDEDQFEVVSDGHSDHGFEKDDEEDSDKVKDLASGGELPSNTTEWNIPADEQQGQHDGCDNGQTIDGIDDVEVAEILTEAARVNGLEDYDVWFKMIGKPDPRQLASGHI